MVYQKGKRTWTCRRWKASKTSDRCWLPSPHADCSLTPHSEAISYVWELTRMEGIECYWRGPESLSLACLCHSMNDFVKFGIQLLIKSFKYLIVHSIYIINTNNWSLDDYMRAGVMRVLRRYNSQVVDVDDASRETMISQIIATDVAPYLAFARTR